MNKKEIMEIKRRFKKESCSIQRLAGCYVNSGKEKLLTFSENFLALEDEEFHKYLEIANKTMSGTIGDHLLELQFPTEEEITEGGRQKLLLDLRNSGLTDEDLLNRFYDHVIETYDFLGNYLILLYHDVYDIPMKTTDNLNLGDSEEVYDYIICSICPVNLSKPGLGYREDENRIGALLRDWVVNAVDTGFTFPAFTDRSADLHALLAYTKDVKEPHKEFWENGLGVASVFTSTEKRFAFTNMVASSLGLSEEDAAEKVLDVQLELNDYIINENEKTVDDAPVILQPEAVTEILEESGIASEPAEKITKKFEEFFAQDLPEAAELLDAKALKANSGRVEKKELQEKVVELTDQLKEAGVMTEDGKTVDVVIKVNDQLLEDVTTAYVNGKKCVVIPIEDAQGLTINGKPQDTY